MESLGLSRMISYNKALKIIQTNIINTTKSELIDVEDCLDRILMKNQHSKCNYPRENLSSMDGVVIYKNDINNLGIKIIGEIKAGDKRVSDFKKGESKFIYTGGPVPGNNKLIIPKEDFLVKKNNLLQINNKNMSDFIRKKGSDFKIKDLCLKKNTIMNLRSISLAQAMNIKKLRVLKKPKVYIIVTGDELINKSRKTPLVNSTNKFVINFLVKKFGGKVKGIFTVGDNIDELNSIIKDLGEFDIIISSGGISKGKYDLVKKAVKLNNFKILFDKVAIKPGKPTTFGILDKNKYFLGLPGNPVSCFNSLLFFLPKILNSFYNLNSIKFSKTNLALQNKLEKNNHLTKFLRIKINKRLNSFTIFKKQDSSLIKILNESDGIFIRKPHANILKKGEICQVIPFERILSNQI